MSSTREDIQRASCVSAFHSRVAKEPVCRGALELSGLVPEQLMGTNG